MDGVKKYATALFGLAIFILAILAIRTSGVLEAMLAPRVEAGNVSAVDATWFLTVAESVVGFIFTWAVVFFVRLGESGIAFGRTFFGFKSVPSQAAKDTAKQASDDINSVMRTLYGVAIEKENAVVEQARLDIQSAIKRAISETTEKVSK